MQSGSLACSPGSCIGHTVGKYLQDVLLDKTVGYELELPFSNCTQADQTAFDASYFRETIAEASSEPLFTLRNARLFQFHKNELLTMSKAENQPGLRHAWKFLSNR